MKLHVHSTSMNSVLSLYIQIIKFPILTLKATVNMCASEEKGKKIAVT